MADAAESLPLPRRMLAHITNPTLQQELLPRYEALMSRARALRAEPGSECEHELVRELAVLSLDLLERLGSHVLSYLRSDVQGQLDALIRDELRTVDTTRKLALRHLQSSVGVVGKMIELYGDLFRGLPDAVVAALIRDLGDGAWRARFIVEDLDDDFQEQLAWWLSLSVALESTLGDLDDLTYWARRAIEGSRKVEALLPRIALDARAAQLQLRARWAWEDWDEEDIGDELATWRELSE